MVDTDALVFGHSAIGGIVAVEADAGAGTARIYRRDGSLVERLVLPLQAWVLARKHQEGASELAGPHPLRHLLLGSDGRAMSQLARGLASDQRLAYLDPVTAHLVAGGETFYRGLQFGDLRRLQFDIETLDIFPEREDAQICLIALRDSTGFERVLALDEFAGEAQLIQEFARLVRERDPDVIEGHNVFNFDLWYLDGRARGLGVPLVLGRDARTPLWLDESIRRTLPNGMIAKYYRIEGRQIVDTFYGAMRWDVGRRLPNYKLKHIVQHLGIGDDARAMVNAAHMRRLWTDPAERAKLKAYCLDDARDAQRLSDLVTPNEFYQAQMVPESLQGIAFVGIGSRIERMLVRAYLRARHSIPRPRATAAFEGAYTAAFETGVFRGVAKCDVESLYPSLMLARNIAPQDDTLGCFLPMLRALREMRVKVKREATQARVEERDEEYTAADGLQNAFKILINSFYGFLGTSGLHFNDPAAAARVTEAGRVIMERILADLRAQGCRVIEADTDGAFFVPPAGAPPEDVVARVGQTLGGDLNLVCEERYPAMLSLKAKNYVLQRADGELVMKGSALRSARDEPFGRQLVRDIARALIEDRAGGIAGIVRDAIERVRAGQLSVEEFARRESITSKTFSAAGSRRLAQALAERGVVVGDKVRVYQRTGGELALAEEYANDEDRDYLLRRIADFVARFGDLVPGEAQLIAGAVPGQLSLL